MKHVLLAVTILLVMAGIFSNNPELQRGLIALAIFPGWLTWAAYRNERNKWRKGE